MIPSADKIVICFAHVAYRLQERFSALETGINSFAVRDPETLMKRVGEADVLVISGLWQNQLLDQTKRLRFIQSIGAGTDQFPREELASRGIRLASARGVNARAVAEHAMALMLALSRRLPGGPRQPTQAHLAGDDRRSRPTRGRTRRQDAPCRRLGRHRRTTGPTGQGLRYARRRSTAPSGFRAAVLRMRCTPWTSSTCSCPMPISSPLPVR